VLAAAGIVALETMVDRLADDHANARRLAGGLSALPGVILDPDRVQTNIVIFELTPKAPSPVEFAADLAAYGIKVNPIGGRKLRAVTHYGIESADVDAVLQAAAKVLGSDGRS
jgi:threonine aldolase